MVFDPIAVVVDVINVVVVISVIKGQQITSLSNVVVDPGEVAAFIQDNELNERAANALSTISAEMQRQVPVLHFGADPLLWGVR